MPRSLNARPTCVNAWRSTGGSAEFTEVSPAFGVNQKWLARSEYKLQNIPFVSTTSRIPVITVRVDSAATSWA